jgi:hypothetical protein
MTANVGTVDRIARLLIGTALIVAPLLNFMGIGASMATAYTIMGIGAILALTAIFSVCPLYSVLGLSTNKV